MIGKWSTNNAMVPKSYEDFLTLNHFWAEQCCEVSGVEVSSDRPPWTLTLWGDYLGAVDESSPILHSPFGHNRPNEFRSEQKIHEN